MSLLFIFSDIVWFCRDRSKPLWIIAKKVVQMFVLPNFTCVSLITTRRHVVFIHLQWHRKVTTAAYRFGNYLKNIQRSDPVQLSERLASWDNHECSYEDSPWNPLKYHWSVWYWNAWVELLLCREVLVSRKANVVIYLQSGLNVYMLNIYIYIHVYMLNIYLYIYMYICWIYIYTHKHVYMLNIIRVYPPEGI